MFTRLLLGCVLGMALVTFSPAASVNAHEGQFMEWGEHGHGDDHGFGGFGGGSGERGDPFILRLIAIFFGDAIEDSIESQFFHVSET